MKFIFFIFFFGIASVASAHGKTCSPQEAEAADAIIDQIDTWAKVDSMFKKFRHCDDGSIAEGNSEAIARLLVDRWDTLPQLEKLTKLNPPLKRFVLSHIDTTLNSDDLEKIKELSMSSCPQNMTSLCKNLNSSSTRALE
ncbi:hypothetical protein AAKU55_003126 [Oxalobacteraceae bacterium GrIS 1.11]